MKRVTLTALLLTWVWIGAAFAGKQKEEASKTINKTFTLKSDATVEVDNKFGKVHVTTGDGNTLTVDVKLTAKAGSMEKAQKLLENLDVKFNEGADGVKMETQINGKSSQNGNSSWQVDYTIKMPKANHLKVDNRFGDFYVNDLDGRLELDVSYGDSRIGKLSHLESEVDVDFGKVTIESAKKVEVEISYGEVDLGEANILELDSEFSKLDLGAFGEMEIDSKYDELKIDAVGVMDADLQFTDLKCGKLTKKLDVDNHYGKFEIEKVTGSVEGIDIDNEFATVKLDIDLDVKFNVSGEFSFCDLKVPNGEGELIKKNKTMHTVTYEGYIGAKDSGHTMTIDSSYGNVELE